MRFIVFGTSGFQEWAVGRPYSTEYAARSHAELANRWAQQHGCVHTDPGGLPPNPFDARMQVYRTGVEYHYEEAILI